MPGVLCNPLGGPQSKIHALLGCCNPDAIDDLVFCNPPNCKSIYLQSCYNSDRLHVGFGFYAILTQLRKVALGLDQNCSRPRRAATQSVGQSMQIQRSAQFHDMQRLPSVCNAITQSDRNRLISPSQGHDLAILVQPWSIVVGL